MTISASEMEFAEGWRPSPGSVLAGEVIEISTRNGDYGAYPIVTIRTDEGEEKAFHAHHTVASNELARIAPQVGERIGILYRGLVKRADAPDFHSYRVKSLGGNGKQFDWTGERNLASQDPTPEENTSPDPSGGEEGLPF